MFNCVPYCVGYAWIDAFDYSWSGEAKNRLFSNLRLIIPAIVHFKKSKITGFFVNPLLEMSCFLPTFDGLQP
jgi:hypothetical protein